MKAPNVHAYYSFPLVNSGIQVELEGKSVILSFEAYR